MRGLSFAGGQVDFPYPLLVSSMGLVFAAVTTHSMVALGYLKLDYQDVVTKRCATRPHFLTRAPSSTMLLPQMIPLLESLPPNVSLDTL